RGVDGSWRPFSGGEAADPVDWPIDPHATATEEHRECVAELIRPLQRRHVPGSFDPVEDGAGNILGQQPRSVPADVVVLAEHYERGDLDRLQGAMHAKK